MLFLVFCVTQSFAQDTIYYKQLVASKQGENIKIKYRSAVTGQKASLYLQDGKWLALDSFGNTLVEANYKANKLSKYTRKHGLEIFLDPQTGDTILIKNYNKGELITQLANQEAIFVYGAKVYHTYKDFGSFSIAEYHVRKGGKVDFTSLWRASIEDPNNITENAEYLAFEDSIGDPNLLAQASYSTKQEYNYVNNAEFEVHPAAKFSIVSFSNQIPYWSIASESPDFYLSSANARSGNSFMGFRVFSMKKHIEYLQNELKEPLKKDQLYCFSAYLKLSPGSKYATNSFGLLATENKQYINTDELLSVKPTIRLNKQVLSYKTRWMKVQCQFKANGNEKYLTLGSFQNHKELQLIKVPGQVNESYYYLDDVSLVPIANASDCACNEGKEIKKDDSDENSFTDLKVGETLVLEDIHFDNDEAELLPESFPTLAEILDYLLTKNTSKVEISGHTSSLGGLEHNLDLSRRRAKAVKAFLTLNGVEAGRISTQGYGPNQPIARDATSEGQKQNRRVEFKVLAL